ncbi:MAG: 3-ketoacyl-CoA thiolase @ Acetyl-CoA acetyltransferase [uncultured Blastococcus sp.]|uniref:3-ketoacyl-CoA thiolase @ Acetyl-CoA acetyltransferase n=1 Tax=uncultured Blastococcus sp. TaxID=217144 RepID=A0A6J4J479_9ACTN|nr:MAG: 3-ketoacyl-CoA thiolase @ Acetyl-CoA acetyltransferase [uncultured Blastococcus sp.]
MTPAVEDAPVLIAARRTPIGTAGRSLAALTAADLAAPVIRVLGDELEPSGRKSLRDVVLGNCMGPGGNVARVAALQAGLPIGVPGLTVDRQCGSGLAAILLAVSMLREEPGIVLAGGVESASTAPWRSWPPVDGNAPIRFRRAPFTPAGWADPDMGEAADLLAREHGIGRGAQDEYAARSHARAFATQQAGGFAAEIVPLGDVCADDRPRPGLSVERLARLGPAFLPDGTVTAGNSCGVNDGAALVTAVDAGTHRRLDLPGLRVLATATAGVAPDRPGLGIVPATRLALARAGLTLDDVDVIEFNEAFAGQVLACCAELGLDPARVCPEGGALALGHPWGASGAVLAVRLFAQLAGRPGGYGLAAVAVGGGQGVAMVVQSCR